MANELDILMDRDPMLLSAQDIDSIIAYQRRARANFEAGVKPKKETGPKQSLEGVLNVLAPAPVAVPIKRRF